LKRVIVFLVSFAAFFGPFTQSIYVPLIPEVREYFHTSAFLVNLTISIFTLVLAIMQMVYGPLVDRYGRKKILLPAIVIYILSSIGVALSPTIGLFIFFRGLQAVGIAAGSVVATTVIGDLFEGKELGRSMGTFQMLVSLGPVLGPVIGGFVGAYYGFHGVFWVLSAAACILWIAIIYFLPETKTSSLVKKGFSVKDFQVVYTNRIGLTIVLLGFIQYFTYYQFLVFMPYILSEDYRLTASHIGLVFLFMTLSIVIGNFLGGRLQEYFNQQIFVVCTCLCIVIAIVLYSLFAPISFILLLIVITLFGLFTGLATPVQTTILARTFLDNRATAFGLYNLFRYLGMALGPLIGTLLFNWQRFSEIYFSAILFTCVILFARRQFSIHNKKIHVDQ
jgi:MFS transporter, DHA1 family, multidrug resistance protein